MAQAQGWARAHGRAAPGPSAGLGRAVWLLSWVPQCSQPAPLPFLPVPTTPWCEGLRLCAQDGTCHSHGLPARPLGHRWHLATCLDAASFPRAWELGVSQLPGFAEGFPTSPCSAGRLDGAATALGQWRAPAHCGGARCFSPCPQAQRSQTCTHKGLAQALAQNCNVGCKTRQDSLGT